MEKIAVVGLSCLFPGAQDPAQFWQNLITEQDSTSLLTKEQIGVDPEIFYDPEGEKDGTYYCMRGGFIRNFRFDASRYKIPAAFLESLDNIFKWSLYVAEQALIDGNYLENPATLARCGVILGNLSAPTRYSQRLVSPIYRDAVSANLQELLQQPNLQLEGLPSPENISLFNMLTAGYPTTVVAQALSLGSTHFTIDAACSSALYTVKLACHYLMAGKADLMLAGAISCADPFVNHSGFSLLNAYPDDSITRPLDRNSGGLVTAEGAGMLALKRYSDAVRDGDKIYATILGVGLSNDGRGRHFVSPNPKGQITAFERTYRESGVNPQTIDYVECHATGTDLGDRTEINSMDTFFGQYGSAPLVGSVKSNLGHLLTAAGMPSLIKVILSMSKGLIPPTIHLQEPLCSANNVIGADQIVKSTTPWQSKAPVKHAAVTAFGFGGTNAHLVMTQASGEPASVPDERFAESIASPPPALAIVGMDASFGSCDGLDAFDRTIYEGKQHFVPVPPERWKGIEEHKSLLQKYGFTDAPLGAYIQDFKLDFFQFKVPPKLEEQPIPQQLLMLKVADRALKDAGIQEGGNVAVIIAMETDLTSHQYRARCDTTWQIPQGLSKANIPLPDDKATELEEIVKDSLHTPREVGRSISYIGNIMACRISSVWDFSGPAFTLSAEENSVFKALEVAQLLLMREEVDAVIVGAVDLAGGVEHVLLRNQLTRINTGTPTLGFDTQSNGWMIGEGAGAVVLKRVDRAKPAQDRIYAVIDAISLVQDNYTANKAENFPHPPQASAVAQACRQALTTAGITPKDIGYLEVFGSGIVQEDAAEITGLLQTYQTGEAELSCAIGSVKANIGHTFAASGIASLIKTALCLYHRYIPATPQWSTPKPSNWQDSPFYVAPASTLWSLDEHAPKRIAAINGLGLDGAHAHLILSEDPDQTSRTSSYLEDTPFYLFPIAASDQATLLQKLKELQYTIDECTSLAKAASQTFSVFQKNAQADYSIAIVGHNKDELTREIQRALKAVPKAFEQAGEWSTPLGSYFTAKPLGKQGGVAFVYAGGFTSFINQGRDSYRLFPKAFDAIARFSATDHPKRIQYLSSRSIYPRSLTRLTKRQLESMELRLLDDPEVMLLSGTTSAILFTLVMREYFQVKPQAAFGYSLGELSMMFALNVWNEADNIIKNLETSPLFKTRLTGPKNAVREYWGLPPDNEQASSDFWSTYVLIAPVERVKEAVEQEDRVYLTHINTSKEVVIAGDKQRCLSLIERLGCDYIPAPGSSVLHCKPIESEYQELTNWLTLPVDPQADITFYSASHYGRSVLDTQTIAHNIAKSLCDPVDFPRLINQVYDGGARIFIEAGAGGTCSRWIRETLKNKDHLTLAGLTRGVDDHTLIVRSLAKLVSHRVELNLSPLYTQVEEELKPKKSLIGTVTVGGRRISSVILSEKNQKNFMPYKAISTAREVVSHQSSSFAEKTSETIANNPSRIPVTVGNVQAIESNVAARSLETTKPRVQEKKMPIQTNGNGHSEDRPTNVNLQPETHSQPERFEPSNSSESSTETLTETPQTVSFRLPDYETHYRKLNESLTLKTQTHAAFLRSRQESLAHMGQLIERQIVISQQMLNAAAEGTLVLESPLKSTAEAIAVNPATAPVLEPQSASNLLIPATPLYQKPAGYQKPAHVIFDEADLLELSRGKISSVFGKEYEEVDSYPRCIRIPMPPYLFMSRVIKLEAERGRFEPCMVETEYDIPQDAWYANSGYVPCAIPIEASHGNIFLASYLGVDSEYKGQRVYRALGGKTTFVSDLPKVGEMLRCEIRINSFSRGGDTLLFFFTHDCYVGDRLFLKMESGAGFFTEDDLKKGQGITLTEREKQERSKIQKRYFEPLLRCHKSSFSDADIFQLSKGNHVACFGDHYDQNGRNPFLRLPDSAIRMLDRVISVDPTGGAWGLGLIVGEKTLRPEDWFFNCHFKDDYCMPGTVISEGCAQLLQFYGMYLGLQIRTTDAVFQTVPNVTQSGRYRGQITPTAATLTYQLEVTEIGLNPKPYLIADAYVIFGGKTISITKNIAAQLSERDP